MGIETIFQNQHTEKLTEHKRTDTGSYGMAASAVKEATDAGTKVLEEGGNAIDAIVAIQLALAAVEGMNTGIGAGGYIVYYNNEENKTEVIQGHSKAPAAVTPRLFMDEKGEIIPADERSVHARAVAVPGMMKALEVALERHGTMPLERLIEPAIQLAEEEYRVNFLWEQTLDLFKDRLNEDTKKVFVPNCKPLREGDRIRQPDLAKTLRIIRDKGFKSLYEGELADAVVETVQQNGGLLSKKDLKNYEVKIEEPLWGSYKEYDLAFPAPPNGGGFTVAQMLKLLEPYNLSQYDRDSWQKYHLIAEFMRLAMEDRLNYIEDPDVTKIPMTGLLHPDYLEERRELFSFERRLDDVKCGDPWQYEDREAAAPQKASALEAGFETTHFTAVDRWGNIASCTSSIERIFGSGIMLPGYGFILNNDLTDFNPEPGSVNEPNANKYPVSSKTPTIVFHEGKPFFTLGSPGGPTIIASVLQVLINVLEYEMDLEEAIAAPRIYNSPKLTTEWEDGIKKETLEILARMGYNPDYGFNSESSDNRIGDVQAILIDPLTGDMYGAADSPRPGGAEGLDEPPKD
ncbi:gamma-glutamyltransferase [Planomicrobium sp. CPCC 101079]|uniref:gamma-glutamyltransferase n=1 Tax=Planomicrobium sp. CPCC 101079 TaxID=2599618 RepID=UPI0011B7C821|nr:gamma-glutamyltransferase [Planomicrobium sp. CPCC 101079]TWT01498.1 gamma-glutamyltransferase [Planomicrobium sp. CPCC 101079]